MRFFVWFRANFRRLFFLREHTASLGTRSQQSGSAASSTFAVCAFRDLAGFGHTDLAVLLVSQAGLADLYSFLLLAYLAVLAGSARVTDWGLGRNTVAQRVEEITRLLADTLTGSGIQSLVRFAFSASGNDRIDRVWLSFGSFNVCWRLAEIWTVLGEITFPCRNGSLIPTLFLSKAAHGFLSIVGITCGCENTACHEDK